MRFPHKAAMIRKQGGSVWLSHRLAGLLSHSREAFRRLVIGPAEVGCDFVKQYLDDLVRQGKVLYVGISDAPAWWIAQANTLAHLRGWSAFIGLQIEYSLIERTVERELIPMAKALNLGLLAWSPLANGVLAGKYHGHGSSEPGRMSSDAMKQFLPEQQRTDRIVAAVRTMSDEVGRSMAQVALAWLRYRPVPVIPIIGAKAFSVAG